MISAKEFTKRRSRLLKAMGPGSIALIPTAHETVRNRDVEYPFRPDSDFFYLTGFNEPDALAVLIPGRKEGSYLLFCRARNPEMETWTGKRAGVEGAQKIYGADQAFTIEEMESVLPGLLEGKDRVFYFMGKDGAFDQRLMDWRNQVRKKNRSGVQAPSEFFSLDNLMHELRLFKSNEEIAMMRQAAAIAAAGHRRAMQACRPGLGEYELEAELLHEFIKRGARHVAYECIVGAGANACILHYRENNSLLNDGDLLLIDAGAEYNYYASDITRTFPVNGKFSAAQREIYEVVLEAQLAAIEKVKSGNRWNDPHDAAVRVLTKGMVELGLLKGNVQTLIKDGSYRKFYMHRTGHWLGMDVHDVGEYKVNGKWRVLEPGMVMTVEPGIYIPAQSEAVDKKWWNIGIRIEDDVLVTRQGNEVLTAQVPKTVKEIEALMAQPAKAEVV